MTTEAQLGPVLTPFLLRFSEPLPAQDPVCLLISMES